MSKKTTTYKSEKETLKHIRCYEAPPAGFNPFTADSRLLTKHGFPRRPDAEKESDLRRIWDRAFASKPVYIKAQVSIDPILSRRNRTLVKFDRNKLAFSPRGWGGAVQQTVNLNLNPPEPVVTVYGEWFIPTITPLINEPGTAETVGFWVGIDGFGNNQVLQAGSAATITGRNISYWVWTEWFPLDAIRVDNFAIRPGDYLTVLVCANTPTHGFCTMMNKTTNQITSIGITNPPGVTSMGATAEWIVEGISDILPAFSSMVFANCSAGTRTHKLNCRAATITEITGAGGALTSSSVLSDTSCMVKWVDAR